MLKLIVLVAFSMSIATIDSKSLSWGNLRNNNLLLFDQLFVGRGTALNSKVFFFSTKGIVISAIHVNDMASSGGGDAIVLQGGPGFTYVRMKLYPNYIQNRLLLNVQIFGEHDRVYDYEFYE